MHFQYYDMFMYTYTSIINMNGNNKQSNII